MKVLVIGAGGREHALVWKLAGERNVSEVISVPGNPGTSRLARIVRADSADDQALLDLAEREEIDLTVVGPELPLSRGIADLFAAEGRLLFGPSERAAELESSKAFAKEFMTRHHVPTARYVVCGSPDDAFARITRGEFGFPVVVKADGLAAGKGVVIAPDRKAADEAIRSAMIDRHFGAAGGRLVIEEYLEGAEASFFCLVDGSRALPFHTAEDHKRAFDHDRGPNTGGMGAFAPSVRLDADGRDRVMREIVTPVVEGMKAEGREFRGFLYVGLMITRDGPRVVEFNVRLGDPEAQVVLPMLDEDLAPRLAAAASGTLDSTPCRFCEEPHVGVVLASRGYPESSETGRVISGLDEAERMSDVLVFHAATAIRDGRVVTAGGRVLTVVARGDSFDAAITRAYEGVSRISFEGMQYRTDIGRKAAELRQTGSRSFRS